MKWEDISNGKPWAVSGCQPEVALFCHHWYLWCTTTAQFWPAGSHVAVSPSHVSQHPRTSVARVRAGALVWACCQRRWGEKALPGWLRWGQWGLTPGSHLDAGLCSCASGRIPGRGQWQWPIVSFLVLMPHRGPEGLSRCQETFWWIWPNGSVT